MTIEYPNAGKRFDKPILSAFANSNTQVFEFALYSWPWYRQIFFENFLPNRRFGVEIVYLTTISTIYNHYKEIGVESPRRPLPTGRFYLGFVQEQQILIPKIHHLCRFVGCSKPLATNRFFWYTNIKNSP